MQNNPLSRRSFITSVAFGSVITRIGGGYISLPVAVRADDGFGTGTMRLRIADYPGLGEDYGSIRVGTSAMKETCEPFGLYYPVIINRAPGGRFYALNARCPHEGCTVPELDAISRNIICPRHFSRFEVDGSYIEGPANGPLAAYNTQLINGDLLVEIPELPFKLTIDRRSPGEKRLAIEFLAFSSIIYEVHYRPSFAEVPVRVNFAQTLTGEFDQSELPGIDDIAVVYVPILNNPAGIYTVAMKTSLV